MKLPLLLLLFLWNTAVYQGFQDEVWNVPETAKKVANPTDAEDPDDIEFGNEIYLQLCSSCHGIEGRGDGKMSKVLELKPKNFVEQKFQSQTDGTIFFKITTGRGEMPAFEKKVDEEERWYLVNYLRTLSQ